VSRSTGICSPSNRLRKNSNFACPIRLISAAQCGPQKFSYIPFQEILIYSRVPARNTLWIVRRFAPRKDGVRGPKASFGEEVEQQRVVFFRRLLRLRELG